MQKILESIKNLKADVTKVNGVDKASTHDNLRQGTAKL